MEMKEARKLWRELFGIEIGAKVKMKQWLWEDNPYMFIWGSFPIVSGKELAKIPIDKFVGVVVGREMWDEERYLIKWIADRRPLDRMKCFAWHRGAFDILEEDEDEV